MRIIFFDIDCLRPDHLGCYGYERPTSPTIDKIAKEGIRFDNYHCASSPCLPSRTAWASGRFGIRNGVISNHGAGVDFHIDTRLYGGPKPNNEMLMRHLRKNGYDTIAFSNFADRHNALWFMYGWSEYHTPNLKGGTETADEVNAPLLRWIKTNAKRDNYFLYINYWDTHRTYKMDESYAERFNEFPIPQKWPDENTIKEHQNMDGFFTAQNQFRNNKSPVPLMPGAINNRKDFEHLINGYDAAIAYVDEQIEIVLEEFKRQNLLENTVIIISGDHGDAFGEHGIYSDHVCADECIHNIPLIIRWPDVSAKNKLSKSLLYNVDFAPTLCDLLDFPIPEKWDGKSFRENIEGKKGLDRKYLVWDHGLYAIQRAIRTKSHLMIITYDDLVYDFQPVELYDIENDPYQVKNIANDNSELVQYHSYLLAKWRQKIMEKDVNIVDPIQKILLERTKKSTLDPVQKFLLEKAGKEILNRSNNKSNDN